MSKTANKMSFLTQKRFSVLFSNDNIEDLCVLFLLSNIKDMKVQDPEKCLLKGLVDDYKFKSSRHNEHDSVKCLRRILYGSAGQERKLSHVSGIVAAVR